MIISLLLAFAAGAVLSGWLTWEFVTRKTEDHTAPAADEIKPYVSEVRLKTVDVYAETEVDEWDLQMDPYCAEYRLKQELGKAVWEYAVVMQKHNLIDCKVKLRGMVTIVDSGRRNPFCSDWRAEDA